MNSSRNSFEMVCFSRFIILQSVVTRYLFVQKVVNCCYILIQVLWPFIYGLGVNFLAVYETGWNSGEWLTRGLLIFITLGFFGLLVGIFAPKKEAQENRHRVRCVIVNVLLYVLVLYIIARWYGLAHPLTMTITI